jgi:hypothetical protein
MRFDPSIFISRVVVEAGRKSVYDEKFHKGLNVIRGANSSGKSTILNFIFYGLGGDYTDWSEAAKRCNRVTVEAEISGKLVTLSREVSLDASQPMDIFGGDYELSRRAPRGDWVRYPYRRSDARESFSQALFRLLGMPEVRSEATGHSVTMHQILRLLYADQLSPIDEIFRAERFDPALLRDIVGRLLCGAYSGELYSNEIELRDLERELVGVTGELRSLFAVVGRAGEALTYEWIDAERARLTSERHKVATSISEAEHALFAAPEYDRASRGAQDEAYEQVQVLQEQIAEVRRKRDGQSMAMADTDAFVGNLKGKMLTLGEAKDVAEIIGTPQFHACPACLAPVSADHDPSVCHLCKSPFDAKKAKGRIASIINDMALQIRQSELLQLARSKGIETSERQLTELDTKWRIASHRLKEFSRLPSSEARDRLRQLHRQAGYLEREYEDLEQRARSVELVHQLSTRKEKLSSRIGSLRAAIHTARQAQQAQFEKAKTSIADEILSLLRDDLIREEAFEDPQTLRFDFAANNISVDDQSYFSASSRAILKSSFSAGMLIAAAKLPFFRHPRFCMIDTIEDKGMEPDRSRNFQMQLQKRSAELKSDHQFIIATAMIAPSLDEEKFTVGRFSTSDERTLGP